MATITEDYVSFEIAKLLKEKGFEGDVNAYYHIWDNGHRVCPVQEFSHSEAPHLYIPAPTQSMAMKWLREVHKIYIDVYIVKNYSNKTVEYCITIEDLNFPSSDDGIDIGLSYKSYEEACKAAIKYCLENLIK